MFVKFWGYSFFNGILHVSPNRTNHVIAFGHLKFVNKSKSMVDYIDLIVPFSKPDQNGKGKSVILKPTKNYVCPVLWLKKYTAMRSKIGGQLFVHLDGSPLTRFQFCSVLNSRLKLLVFQNLFTNFIPSRLGRRQTVFRTVVQNWKLQSKVDGVPMP